MAKKTIEQVDIASKRVLMRVDFNVPLDENGAISDDLRIRNALPSIRSVLERNGRLILMSHLGRPDGKGYEPSLSLAPAADRLRELLDGVTVHFVAEDCIGEDARAAVDQLGDGEVLLLENLRFHAGEKKGDAQFAQVLAAYGDVYCNDAFGTAHRADASMVAVPKAMEGKPRVVGMLMDRELRYISGTLEDPTRPFVAVLGGAKVSDKLGAIGNLLNRVDTILVGGAMAFTFLRALGHTIGSSLVQLGMLDQARDMLDDAGASKTDLLLPHDHVCGKELTRMTPVEVYEENIPEGWMGFDIGPKTVERYGEILHDARTIIWNGPMGAFETDPFDVGTNRVARVIAEATDRGATSVLGGGDTAAAVQTLGLADRYSHISTGGGASVEMLEGKSFEAVELLDDV